MILLSCRFVFERLYPGSLLVSAVLSLSCLFFSPVLFRHENSCWQCSEQPLAQNKADKVWDLWPVLCVIIQTIGSSFVSVSQGEIRDEESLRKRARLRENTDEHPSFLMLRPPVCSPCSFSLSITPTIAIFLYYLSISFQTFPPSFFIIFLSPHRESQTCARTYTPTWHTHAGAVYSSFE